MRTSSLSNTMAVKDCLDLANKMVVDCDVQIPRITSIQDLDSYFFDQLFGSIFKFNIALKDGETNRFDHIINTLSVHILDIDLSHISAIDLVNKKSKSIFNLLEILDACHLYLDLSKHDTVHRSMQTICQNEQKSSSSSTMEGNEYKKSNPQSSSSSSISFCNCQDVLHSTPLPSCSDSNHSNHEHIYTSMRPSIQEKTSIKQMASKSAQTPTKKESNKELNSKLMRVHRNPNLMAKLEQEKSHTFALEVGYKIQEALRLRTMTKQIEANIENYFDPQHKKGKIVSKRKVVSVVSPKRQRKRLCKISKKSSATRIRSPSLEEILLKFPGLPKEALTQLKMQENLHMRFVKSVNKDVNVCIKKNETNLKEAIEREERRSNMLIHEIKHLENVEEKKRSHHEHLREKAISRGKRMEKARIHVFAEDYYREVLSRYKGAQAKEEQLAKEAFTKQLKQSRANLLEFKANVKEEEAKEAKKQRLLIEAFENLYKTKFEMINEQLNEEQFNLKNRLKSQTRALLNLESQFKRNINAEMKRMVS